MTPQETNRAILYVTTCTSHGRDTVAEILGTGFQELTNLALNTSQSFERAVLLGYICQWTVKRTRQPEHVVREVFECAGRWLDKECDQVAASNTSPS